MKCFVASFNELEDNSWSEFTLELAESSQSIIVYKNGERLKAFNNLCPHQGRRLDYASGKFLFDAKANMICPAHGAEFEMASGECINGPCKGQSLQAIKLYLENNKIYAIV